VVQYWEPWVADTEPSPPHHRHLSATTVIVGIVIAVGACCLIGAGIWLCCRARKGSGQPVVTGMSEPINYHDANSAATATQW